MVSLRQARTVSYSTFGDLLAVQRFIIDDACEGQLAARQISQAAS